MTTHPLCGVPVPPHHCHPATMSDHAASRWAERIRAGPWAEAYRRAIVLLVTAWGERKVWDGETGAVFCVWPDRAAAGRWVVKTVVGGEYLAKAKHQQVE